MNAATIAAITSANVAAQNAMQNSSNTNYFGVLTYSPLSVIVVICMIALLLIWGIRFVEFSFEHPIISSIILVAIIILCVLIACV